MAQQQHPLPLANLPWIDPKTGRPTQGFAQFMQAVSNGVIGPLTSAASDTAAATAGVPIGGLYSNAGAVRVRLV